MSCPICSCPRVRWLRVSTLARHFQCSEKKIRRLVKSGSLEGVRLGGEWRVDHESVDRLVQHYSLGVPPEHSPVGPGDSPGRT